MLQSGRYVGSCNPVHCLDRLPKPDKAFAQAEERVRAERGGGLKYHQVDVTHDVQLDEVIAGIAAERQRVDGLIAGMPDAVCSEFWVQC